MRKVNKNLVDIPSDLRKPRVEKEWDEIAKTGNMNLIKERVYKGTYKDARGKTQSSVRDKLNEFYHHKCGYCEQLCKAEIEHYRPKKGVTEDPAHPGYYWLCYEWSNLVPSCRYCNTEGGKGNQFPVRNTRVVGPQLLPDGNPDRSRYNAVDSPLIEEQPYLLHPEIDRPEIHLIFEISPPKDGILIKGRDTEGRGNETIRICNLNRTDLKIARLTNVFSEYRTRIHDIFTFLSEGALPPENLPRALSIVFRSFDDDAANETKEHTLLRKYIVADTRHFETVFAPYIEAEDQREIAILAFRSFKGTP